MISDKEFEILLNENMNRVDENDLAKTIFFARTDLILTGSRVIATIFDQIEEDDIRVANSLSGIVRDNVGRRNYSDVAEKIKEKIENGEIRAGPCIYGEDYEVITAVMIFDEYNNINEYFFLSGEALEEFELKPIIVEYER